jgi:hypothetical protein
MVYLVQLRIAACDKGVNVNTFLASNESFEADSSTLQCSACADGSAAQNGRCMQCTQKIVMGGSCSCTTIDGLCFPSDAVPAQSPVTFKIPGITEW